MYIIAIFIIITFAVLWYNTRPATKEETHYREEFENGFDADYKVQDKWRREYEHMN